LPFSPERGISQLPLVPRTGSYHAPVSRSFRFARRHRRRLANLVKPTNPALSCSPMASLVRGVLHRLWETGITEAPVRR
jgi:hypothetical protein